MSRRARVAVLVVLVVVLGGGALGYVVLARSTPESATPAANSRPTIAASTLAEAPHIVFRNATLGGDLGRVALSALDDPGGPRALTDLTCDRVFAAAGRTLCLSSEPGLVTKYTAAVYDDATGERVELPLTGSPSRARLSGDGRLAATTSFVAGDSYATTGFSTRTVVTDLTTGTSGTSRPSPSSTKGRRSGRSTATTGG